MSIAVENPMQVKGCCPLDCQDSCAWVAHVEDGKVIRVEGAKDHPVTRGVLCAKVKDYEQRLTAEGRLLHPLRRAGPKGAGQFERISWDEALGTIATRFKAIIAEHGAEALMPFQYLGTMGMVQRFALMRIFHALGASNAGGNVCGASASSLLGDGHPMNVDPEETPDARLIILWGQNTLTTCHHQWHFIEEARKKGARDIAIDPCRTRTAKMCDEHLAIRPGSDAVLAAAIGRHLLATGRADLELAEFWTTDLETYRSEVDSWTFECAAAATGLPQEQIANLAEAFATARPALIRCGIAPQQTAQGETFVRGLSAISILGGHWRHRGGGLLVFAFGKDNDTGVARPDLCQGNPRTLDRAKLAAILNDEALTPPVKGLMVWSANPAATQIDGPATQRGLSREDLFTVVIDHFLTDTARYADIVLPATTQFEHVDVQSAWGHHYLLANNPAVAPFGETRSSGAIMRGLAAKLGLDDPLFMESDEEMAAAGLPEGWVPAELKETGWRKSSYPRPPIAPRQNRFTIASGGVTAPKDAAGSLLQVLNPKSHYFLNSTFANMPRNRKSQGAPTATLHPNEARSRGLANGDRVRLRREGVKVDVALAVSDAVREGVVTLEGKWWEEGREDAVPLNRLTPSKWSPAGQPAYNEAWVMVEKVG